jgi:predicted transcriptional regulator
MAYPTYAHQDPPVKLRLRRLLLELKPLEEKYWEAQQLVQQMAVHEVGLWVQAILEKPLPMQWMHNLSIHILGELLQRHPAVVTSEFGKVGTVQSYKITDTMQIGWGL